MTRQTAARVVGGGVKSTAIDFAALDKQFPELFGGTTALNTAGAYSAVSWIYRCVNLRADTLSGLPRAFYRLGSDEEVPQPAPYQDVDLARLMWLTEAARCLWGVAYWERDRTLHWLNPSTMTVTTWGGEIERFDQSGQNGASPETWKPQELVYLPLFGPTDDLKPGVAPAQVALTSAGLAQGLLLWAEGFFTHGAIPAVLLTTDQSIREDEPELKRIGAMWRRLFGGVTRAWETAVLSKGLKPTVLTAPVNTLAIPELSDEVREDLAACFGIPITKLQQSAANYATAQQDDQSYYQDTLFPEDKRLVTAVNQQLWHPLGYEWRTLYGQVEAVQKDEAEKSAGISSLMDQVNKQYDGRLLTRGRAVFLVEALWAQMGLEFPADLVDEEPEEEAPEATPTPQAAPTAPGEEPEGAPAPEAEGAGEIPPEAEAALEGAERMRKALAKWHTKASKRGGDCPFESADVPAWAAKTVHHRLLTDPATAFEPFLADVKSYPIQAERSLARAIGQVYGANMTPIISAVRRGAMPDLGRLNTQLRGALIGPLQQRVSEYALAQGASLGWGQDYDRLLLRSEEWARARAEQVITLTQQTNASRLQSIIDDVGTGALTADEAEDMVGRLFSDARAEGIATYEITGAMAEAALELAGDMRESGLRVVTRWLTAEDERVCPVCAPLDHTTEEEWGGEFPGGPPAHHRCRCMLSVEYDR